MRRLQGEEWIKKADEYWIYRMIENPNKHYKGFFKNAYTDEIITHWLSDSEIKEVFDHIEDIFDSVVTKKNGLREWRVKK